MAPRARADWTYERRHLSGPLWDRAKEDPCLKQSLLTPSAPPSARRSEGRCGTSGPTTSPRSRCARSSSATRRIDFRETDDVMMGCGFPDHEQGYNVGRNAVLLAGFDHHVPAVTVSRFCASSLQTIRMAFHAIKAGEGDQYIAAGVECTSRGAGMTLPVMNPRLDGSNGTGYDVYIPMGMTAENVAERCKVTREAQDEWAALSQQRAVAARESGHFDPEIVGVDIPEDPRRGRRRDPRSHGHPGRRPARRHDGRVARETQACLQARMALSPRATPARSTTAPQPCWSCQRRRPASAASSRGRGSWPPRWRRSAPRSWGSGRSQPAGRCSRPPA